MLTWTKRGRDNTKWKISDTNRMMKPFCYKTPLSFSAGKKNMTRKMEKSTLRAESRTVENYSQALQPNGVFTLDFKMAWEQWLIFFFHFLHFWTRMSIIFSYSCPTTAFWKCTICLFSITGPNINRNYNHNGLYPELHSHLI